MSIAFHCKVAAACALAAASFGTHAAPSRYSLLDLGAYTPATATFAEHINNAGQVLVSTVSGASLIYTPGQGIDSVNHVTGMTGDTYARGLSEAGHIYGSNNLVSFVYTPGKHAELDRDRTVTSVNSSGESVGQDLFHPYQGYRHTPGQGYATVRGYPLRINDAGDVLFRQEAGSLGGIQRRDGSVSFITSPDGGVSEVQDLNQRGDVAGTYETAEGHRHAFLYSAGTMRDLDTFGFTASGAFSNALALNIHGVTVGQYSDGVSNLGGFIADRTGMYDVDDLLDSSTASLWDITGITDINDAGQLVGHGMFNGQSRAFILNPIAAPVPEPATIALMAAAVPLVAWSTRRRRRA